MSYKTFNFYCDESTHLENDRMPFMIIAYVSSAIHQVKLHSNNIKNLKVKHRFSGEIKWTKLSESNYSFYSDLVDYFFATDINFRAVIVDKAKIDKDRIGWTYDDFYFKMYYQLLHHKINMEYTYNVYLDIKDTCSQKKIKKLREILSVKYGNIRNLQFIHSYESSLMQIADTLMGAINYNLRKQNKVIAKIKLIDKIKRHSNNPLDKTTSLEANKFNLFFIDLK
ncbi:MAG: DUF3800 domain-containing protein [Bacteroidales bacterium]|nr:DUF3800 domain-containing protein [Bacteroidales bacterium]